ncbi:3'-5' exonuclease [Kutzneria sp. CA-103260]|uniref:3'-5' exonuclease n=1 Tax=Kutzneria sp. CA-103260 TaxID=2802641 RepID=UPI001BEEBAC7|nr:3'-5' exonuclease [Kutzneria sp. CA-103260]QUQ67193.1 3'-5' exonuclease DinG [Kutzneria sp. CA-103260]
MPITAGVIGEPMSWLVKPALPIRNFAARIHGLTDNSVVDAPAFEEIAADVLKALDADVLVAHNAHVDVGVLQRHLGDWECPEVMDTLKPARRLTPGLDTYRLGVLESFSLAEGLPEDLSPHRATYDALVAAMSLRPCSNSGSGVFVTIDGPSQLLPGSRLALPPDRQRTRRTGRDRRQLQP